MRTVRSLLVITGLALGLAACDASFSSQAASVNGEGISTSSVNQALNTIGSHADIACALSDDHQEPALGAGGVGTYDSVLAANWLTTFIEDRTLGAVVKARHLAISPFIGTVTAPQLTSALGGTADQACGTTADKILSELPDGYRAAFTGLAEKATVLGINLAGVTPTQTGITAYAKSHPKQASNDCISIIEVSTEDSASALTKAARGGANFATLAKAHSIDSSSAASGGDVGCALPFEFPSPLSDAIAALDVSGITNPVPIQSQNGETVQTQWVVAKLTSRTAAPAADVGLSIVASQDAKLSALVDDALAKANVSVDPQYGTWKKVSGVWQVTPRTGPANTLLANPISVTPTAVPSSS